MDNEKLQAEQVPQADGSKPEKEEKPVNKRSELMEWIKDIGLAVVAAVIILQLIQPTIVREHSMQNTLQENDYLFIYKLAYKLGGEPQFGDIVVFQSDLQGVNGKDKLLIKRVIGRPGDTIKISGGMVYLNGEAISESYLKDGYTSGEIEELVIPDGYYFMMGDNRLGSADSRDPRIGLVSGDTFMGKAVFRLFPFNTIGGLYKNK